MNKIPHPLYRIFWLSIAINCLGFTFAVFFAYQRRTVIMKELGSMLGISSIPYERELALFNNDPLEAQNEFLDIGVDTTVTFLFLGNSITYTDASEEDVNKEKRGLASTSKENDYVHRLVQLIANNDSVNVDYSIINIADFERGFISQSFSSSKLLNAKNQKPQYLVVQIGENVAEDDLADSKKYELEYLKLLSFFPNSKKIITIPFWPSKEKEYITTRIAIKGKALLVDLSHLGNGTDVNNFAYSQMDYRNRGVGLHPGDYAMKNIADMIYAGYNAIKDY